MGSNIQEKFNQNITNVFEIPEGDFQGPLRITRPCVVDGKSLSSVWTGVGPTISVEVAGVTIKNLKVRAINNTGDKMAQAAIYTAFEDTKLENVEVSGQLVGFPNEAEDWRLPSIVPLGKFAAEKPNEFTLQINAAADAVLSTDIQGISVMPPHLTKGQNIIALKTEELRDNTLLYGSIFVKTSVTRKICVTGKAEMKAPERHDPTGNIQQAQQQQPMPAQQRQPQQQPATTQQRQPQQQPAPTQQRQPQPMPAQQQRPARQFNFNAPPPPVPVQRPVQPYGPPRGQQPQVQATPSPTVVSPLAEDKNVTWLNAGQRISLQEIQSQPLRIAYFHNHSKIKVDMDGYVFMLGGNGKVSRDEDMIFFGNEVSADRSVKVSKDDDMPIVLIDLNKVAPSIEKIAITYSIYGDESRMNFSLIDEPIMRIFSGVKEVYRFRLKDLNLEKTVVATEIYRYKGAWKFNCVGGGYNDGLKKLCESYGVHIE